MEAVPVKKNEDIQVLRGLAIIFVVLQHYNSRLPTPDWYKAMFTHVAFWGGVDIFFAISGYLIYRAFSRDLRVEPTKGSALQGFAIRRFRRLYPACAAWVLISIGLAFVLTTAPNPDPWPIIKSGFAGLTGWSNLYYVLCVPDYVACGNADFNGVTWSLSAEWQFYAALSLAMLAIGKRRAVLLLLAIALVMASFPAPSWSIPWAFRPMGFMLGALIAMLTETSTWAPSKVLGRGMLGAGLTLALAAPANLPQPFVIPAISIGGAMCLLSSLGGNLYSGKMSAPVRWIGERSYSIYLCHLPSILIVREVLTRAGMTEATPANVALAMIAAVMLIGFLSNLSYKHIENRFQRHKAAEGKVPQRAAASP